MRMTALAGVNQQVVDASGHEDHHRAEDGAYRVLDIAPLEQKVRRDQRCQPSGEDDHWFHPPMNARVGQPEADAPESRSERD
jgi:hypothetical protein